MTEEQKEIKVYEVNEPIALSHSFDNKRYVYVVSQHPKSGLLELRLHDIDDNSVKIELIKKGIVKRKGKK